MRKYAAFLLYAVAFFLLGFSAGNLNYSGSAFVQEQVGLRKFLKEGDIVREVDGLCGYVQPDNKKDIIPHADKKP